MGAFGLPPDAIAWCSLLAALVWLIATRKAEHRARFGLILQAQFPRIVAAIGLIAAVCSLGYVRYYLRGAPRIIDATAYYQQARSFAEGQFTLPLFEPTSALRGRFLYFDPIRHTLAVLFPPGYAAVLSLGFVLGSPFAVGAAIAAALVWSTAALTFQLYRRKDAAALAALFSLITVALRYHTADTMAHGLVALLVTAAVLGTLRRDLPSAGLAGFSLGWLLATRPATFGALCIVCGGYGLLDRRQFRWILVCALTLIPGALLWLLYQRNTTGAFLHPTQLAYYSVADGPPGCFRYGFGKGIGCLFEHGTYVEKRLTNGYGPLQALGVTMLRLRWHSLDVHNFEPLVLGVAVAAWRALRQRASRLLVLAALGVMLAYTPFYFDGDYPGGGARFFVDIIPLEHALCAGWLVTTRWTHAFVACSLLGFAIHGSFEHAKLRDRDGGRPMFEPSVLAAAGVERGLVFVDTDHGFFLGHNPRQNDAKLNPIVLRRHGDAHDRVVWERWGKPIAYHYELDPMQRVARPKLSVIAPDQLLALHRFEAEAQWPALSVEQGWVRPVYPSNDCSSARRGLALNPAGSGVRAELALYSEHSGPVGLRLGFVAQQSGLQHIVVQIGQRTHVIERDEQANACFEEKLEGTRLELGEQSLTIEAGAKGIVVDYWEVEPSR